MTDFLSRLALPAGARQNEKRVGRGIGSGLGKTCGRGMKGQKARQGGNIGKLHFQGGQTPMQRRLPKRGFRVPFPVETVGINVGDLERFSAGTDIDPAKLIEAKLLRKKGAQVKILGAGELSKKLVVKAHSFSASAKEKIEKAGGKVEVIAPPAAPEATESSEKAAG
jgi:large subunit ribosomal protein L15